MAESILVLGAGELGIEVLRGLSKHPSSHSTDITVLLRPSTISSTDIKKVERNDELKALGIRLLPGDIVNSSVSELADIFKPYHTIISCTGFFAGPGTSTKTANAVLKAGVKRYFPWQFGVDYDVIGRGSGQELFDDALDVRAMLRGQADTEWVIVSVGMFTTFLFEPVFGVVDLNTDEKGPVVRALGSWDTEVTVTTPRDIGRITAEVVFAKSPKVRNEIVYTSGDTISYGKLADVVEKVLRKKVEREEWSVKSLEEELSKDPENGIKKYRLVFAAGNGVAWEVKKTFNALLGIEVMDVEQWARENLRI